MFRFLVPLLGYPPLECASLSSHWFSNWERGLGAARHRQRPLFPFVRQDDDLTGSHMPASAPPLSLDFINREAAVNYQSIFKLLITRARRQALERWQKWRQTQWQWRGHFCNSLTWDNWKHIRGMAEHAGLASGVRLSKTNATVAGAVVVIEEGCD